MIAQACQKRVAEDTTGEAHCTGQVCPSCFFAVYNGDTHDAYVDRIFCGWFNTREQFGCVSMEPYH